MQPFQKLEAWKRAHQLTLEIHRLTENFPRIEVFSLGAQLRRLSSAVTMKIAEACGRDHSVDFAQCLGQARGTSVELEYALLLCRDLKLVEPADHETLLALLVEVRKMLSGLMRAANTASKQAHAESSNYPPLHTPPGQHAQSAGDPP